MAKRIIILDRVSGPRLAFRFMLWADVPSTRQAKYANPTFASAYKDASLAEQTALQTGAVAELVDEISVEPGTTVAQIKTLLETRWAVFQAEVTAENPWSNYGTFWDGAAWTNAGVA